MIVSFLLAKHSIKKEHIKKILLRKFLYPKSLYFGQKDMLLIISKEVFDFTSIYRKT